MNKNSFKAKAKMFLTSVIALVFVTALSASASNISYIPLEDNYLQELTQSLGDSATDLTIYVDTTPVYSPSTTDLYAMIEPGTGRQEVVLIDSYDSTAKTLTVASGGRGQNLYFGDSRTTKIFEHPAGAQIMITNNYIYWQTIQTAVNSKLDNDGGNTGSAFDLTLSGSNFRIRKSGNDMLFTDDNQSEVTLSSLASLSGSNDKLKISVADSTEGYLQGKLNSGDGLDESIGSGGGDETLDVSVDVTDFIDTNYGLTENINDIRVNIDTDPGLEFNSGALRTKIKTGGGITRDADGLSISAGFGGPSSVVAGEDIDGSSTPQAVFISHGTTSSDTEPIQTQATQNSGADVDIYGVNFSGQTFTIDEYSDTITKISMMVDKTGTPGGNFSVSIYATNAGVPTGSALATVNTTANSITSTDFTWTDFTLASPLTVTPGAVYAITASTISGDASNYIDWSVGSGSTYSGGTPLSSTNAGSSYSASTNDYTFKVWSYEVQSAGSLYKTDQNAEFRGAFDGFVTSNTTSGNSATYRPSGVISGFTGLTAGAKYYTSSTLGGVTTTDTGLQVGEAISTTEIFINKEKNFVVVSEQTGLIDVSGTQPYQVYPRLVCGFKPSRVTLTLYGHTQGGAASSLRELNFFGDYFSSLIGFALKLGEPSAAFYSQRVDASGVSSLEIVDGASTQTLTFNSFSLNNAGLSFTASTAANTGIAGYGVNATCYR